MSNEAPNQEPVSLTPDQVTALQAENTELKSFYDDFSPIGEHLAANKELLKGIVEGKINDEFVAKVASGEMTQKQADAASAKAAEGAEKAVAEAAKANGDVPLTKEQVDAIVAERTSAVEGKIEDRLEMERSIDQFVAETPDVADFADELVAWYDSHPNSQDRPVESTYFELKGRRMIEQAKEQAERDRAEGAKKNNVAGGNGQAGGEEPNANPFMGVLGSGSGTTYGF